MNEEVIVSDYPNYLYIIITIIVVLHLGALFYWIYRMLAEIGGQKRHQS